MPFEGIVWDVPFFTLDELTRTENRNFIEDNRKITQEQANKLSILCKTLIVPVREKWGAIRVNSAYRCIALNTAVGGASESQHRLCEAMDFELFDRPRGEPLFEVFKWIVEKSDLAYGPCIFELGEWVHLSLGYPYRAKDKCGQALVYKKDAQGKGFYEPYKV